MRGDDAAIPRFRPGRPAAAGARVYGLDVSALRKTGNLEARREAYREEPNPSFATFGPKTRREFLALWDARGGIPG